MLYQIRFEEQENIKKKFHLGASKLMTMMMIITLLMIIIMIMTY